jgi:hypothetical protein
MPSAPTARRRWRPESEVDFENLKKSLEDILSTPRFAASKRYPALLQYVVEKTIRGEVDTLKERTIGIDVFHRPPNYDTNSDTVVRYTAGEVRKRLALYYHEVGIDSPIQIELPAGSYVAEFYVPETLAIHSEDKPLLSGSEVPFSAVTVAKKHRRSLQGSMLWTTIILMLAIAFGGIWWRSAIRQSASPFQSFWAPLVSDAAGQPVLICPGAVVFSTTEQTGVQAAENGKQDPLVSTEIARSISQLTDLLGMKNVPFVLRMPPGVGRPDLSLHSSILIGAYSNDLTMQTVSHLRYRFSEQPVQSIYDATQPSIFWSRPRSWANELGNDYGLFARVRNPETGTYVVVIAGLGRSGTEATAAFVTSPRLMSLLLPRLPPDWRSQNIEVILRTEVRNLKPNDPTLEAVWVWK